MPPGPPTIPILGNAHQIPSTGRYRNKMINSRGIFRAWANKYGRISTFKLGPANIVVLCDCKAIHKLLVEKGSIYSDRPDTYIGNLYTKGNHLAIMQMIPEWREKQKIMAYNFSPNQLDQKHFKVQEAEYSTILMNDLLNSPTSFFNHIRRYTNSVASSVKYGYRAATFSSFWGHLSFIET
ncbi:Cytochrome P450 monooxygenase, partial [Lachnellula occidentalis]